MRCWKLVTFLICALMPAIVLHAQTDPVSNPNCTLIVPDNPLTAVGLSTPYQLTATDPTAGECHETNTNQSAFVQAAVLDPATGEVSIYNPLVIDQNTAPAVSPVVPALPPNAVIGIWFGYNGDTLTLQANPGVLDSNACVNGIPGSNFGQFAYCNAPAFFKAAHHAIRRGKLQVPPLGFAADGQVCPTVRDFFIVDQDQSDNLPTTYLIASDGTMAQKTQANIAALTGATTLGNPSDNRLLDVAVDGALGCTPWKAPDLADPGQMIPSLPLNELQARTFQRFPVALVPAGDPMVLDNNGAINLAKLNAYRQGADQPQVRAGWLADTARYCRHMYRVAPARLLLDHDLLMPDAANPTRGLSPDPTVASSLFTFMAQRFAASYDILNCANLLGKPDPISVLTDAQGVATDATIAPTYSRHRRSLFLQLLRDFEADTKAQVAQ
jgi:hypothetical protein